MKPGLDSAQPPSPAQARAAYAGGVRIWNGYLATRPNLGLARPWTQAEFQVVLEVFGSAVAYCSGWDDPAAVRALAQAWGVLPGLDVERLIRPDGPWVQGWLDGAGAGLYGLRSVFAGRRAAFCVMADYVPDPGASWLGPPPPVPHGWQWSGTHQEYGVAVDRGTYDDSLGGDEVSVDDVRTALNEGTVGGETSWAGTNRDMAQRVMDIWNATRGADLAGAIAALRVELDQLKAEVEAGGSVDAASAIARIEAALKQA